MSELFPDIAWGHVSVEKSESKQREFYSTLVDVQCNLNADARLIRLVGVCMLMNLHTMCIYLMRMA